MSDAETVSQGTDWSEIARNLSPVEIIDEPVLVKKRSRDFFWYSPILNAQLRRSFGDLVALPKTKDELAHCLKVAFEADVPIVLRGGGTGNYGQAVPLHGGLIVETTKMNRVLEIGDGFVRAEAGALMEDVNAALMEHGWEMAMFPSTQNIATIGGFVAGGSSGIGSIANGVLREGNNIIALKALSVEEAPQERTFAGADAQQIHHAWGLNGAITEVTLRTVPTRDWIGCMATFPTYKEAYAAGYALATSEGIDPKLVSVVDARIVEYFPRLKGHLAAGRHLMTTLIPRENFALYQAMIEAAGGTVDLAMDEADRQEKKLPHVFEFAYNHTTLQVLKADRSATYQQVGVPAPTDAEAIAAIGVALGDDVWQHHEFARLNGEVVAFDLPIIWYSTEDRLREINATYEAHGFAVYDAHSYQVEAGGLKNADFVHLAWKKRMDPKGLLNPGKSAAWETVRHLSAEEIEAKAKE